MLMGGTVLLELICVELELVDTALVTPVAVTEEEVPVYCDGGCDSGESICCIKPLPSRVAASRITMMTTARTTLLLTHFPLGTDTSCLAPHLPQNSSVGGQGAPQTGQ